MRRWNFSHCHWWMVGFAVATLAMSVQGSIIYVDTTASGTPINGSSWSQAYRNLQDALAVAVTADDIHIAAGTYYPDEGSGQTDNAASSTFRMIAGVDLFGGYPAGGGTRSVAVCSGGDAAHNGKPCAETADCGTGGTCSGNKTILSGDIDGDDATNCTSCSGVCVDGWCLNVDNAHHVLTYEDADATVVIDGLIVQSGVADGTAIDNQGGALQIRATDKFCYDGTNDGTTCTDNDDCTGGGTCEIEFCLSGGPTVNDCLFRHNHADNHGPVNDHGADSSFDNCSFRGNAAAKGGAFLVDNGSPSITDCLFEDNTTNALPHEGGALWLAGREGTWGCPSDPVPTITDTTFVGNISADGGGGAMWSEATAPVVSGCTFDSNEVRGTGTAVKDGGGAIWIENIPSGQAATITSSLFIGNKVDTNLSGFSNGGAIAQYEPGELNIDTTSFVQNDGRATGGALAIWFEVTTTCTNCLFTGNFVRSDGYGFGSAVVIYVPPGSGETISVDLTNSTFVANNSKANEALITVYFQFGGEGTADVSATNCIFWDNSPNSNISGLGDYSIIEGWTSGGTDNSAADPDFLADAEDCDGDGWGDPPCSGGGCPAGSPDNCDDYGDLRVNCDSPAIDTGDNCAIDFDGDGSTSDDVPYDLDGNDRRVDDADTSDGGNTDCPVNDVSAPMVDRGAYEFKGQSCTVNSDCCSGQVCCDDECVVGECCDDSDCTPEVCKTSTNTCVECLTNEDCEDPEGVCKTTTDTCVECLTDLDCDFDEDKEVCRTASSTCVECLDDDDCPVFGECCKRNACTSLTCAIE